jgi:hypothetical protein
MIQASHKLERGECIEKEEEVDEKYAGLSPPHLSPRKAGGNNVQHYDEEKLGEDISGGTNVVRQVSSSNIVGKIPGAGNDGGFPSPRIHNPQEQQASGVLLPSPQWSGEETSTHEDGVAMGLVSMAISEDVSDGGGGRGIGVGVALSSSRPSQTRAYDSNPAGEPLTPRLGEDGDDSSQGGGPYPRHVSSGSPAVVSSHSTNGGAAFLPRRRESIEHLFIPKEV